MPEQLADHPSPNTLNAVQVRQLCFSYGQRRVLNNLDLTVPQGQIFALLGPNGCGKSTLFRLLSTLAPLDQGKVTLLGLDLASQPELIRRRMGVVFQSPSLDRKLTVAENLRCQLALYGLRGQAGRERINQVVDQLGLSDRMSDIVQTLSGGQKRRVELAKGILHGPELLIMDEPSTGLDPNARLDFWQVLQQLKQSAGVTTLLTTHLLDEADKADQVAIMDAGRIVACGSPTQLRSQMGQAILNIRCSDPYAVSTWLQHQSQQPELIGDHVRLAGANVASWVQPVLNHFGGSVQAIHIGQPSLEDVYIANTGRRFESERNS
jgi:ABC-2 type transport system ATP-binding protein